MQAEPETRPIGITALSIFFLFGAGVSFIAFVSLLLPGSFLEPMWRLNPRAREGFAAIGLWAVVLMCTVSAACLLASIGLWRAERWGYWVAVILLCVNLVGDITNVLLEIEPRAAVGIPIVLAILAYMANKRVRRFFMRSETVPGKD
jgi:amino acid permease